MPIAGRLYDRLQSEFGKGNVLMDFDSIPYGVDFREQIRKIIDDSKVVLALIGPAWVGDRGTARRRIDDPADFVRLEIRYALEKGIPIIPILLNDTFMPSPETLPPEIGSLAYLNGLTLSTGIDFHHHADRLTVAIRRFVNIGGESEPTSPPPTSPPKAAPPTSLSPLSMSGVAAPESASSAIPPSPSRSPAPEAGAATIPLSPPVLAPPEVEPAALPPSPSEIVAPENASTAISSSPSTPAAPEAVPADIPPLSSSVAPPASVPATTSPSALPMVAPEVTTAKGPLHAMVAAPSMPAAVAPPPPETSYKGPSLRWLALIATAAILGLLLWLGVLQSKREQQLAPSEKIELTSKSEERARVTSAVVKRDDEAKVEPTPPASVAGETARLANKSQAVAAITATPAKVDQPPPANDPKVSSPSESMPEWRQRIRPEHVQSIEDAEKLAVAANTQQASLATVNAKDLAIAVQLFKPQNRPFQQKDLLGTWQCSSVQVVEDLGVFAYPAFKCRFVQKEGKLFFEKNTGSQRRFGFLYPSTGDQMVFLGTSSVNDDPNSGDYTDTAGVLVKKGSKTSNRYVLILDATQKGYEAYEIFK